MTDEYLVQVRIKNNLLLKMMEREGYATASVLSRASGISQTDIGKVANLKASGMTKLNPRWRKSIERLAKFLRCLPEDLIPMAQVHSKMERTTGSFTAQLPDLVAFGASARAAMLPPSVAFENAKKAESLGNLLQELTPREQLVLREHFGLESGEEKPLEEIAKSFGLSRERVRQIEIKALSKLRRATGLRNIDRADLALEVA